MKISREQLQSLIQQETFPTIHKPRFLHDISTVVIGYLRKRIDFYIEYEKIVGVIDTSIGGKCGTAIVFMEEGFYDKDTLEKPKYIKYEEISNISLLADEKGRTDGLCGKLIITLQDQSTYSTRNYALALKNTLDRILRKISELKEAEEEALLAEKKQQLIELLKEQEKKKVAIFDRSKTFEVAVISTLSSGKSTFINSLIGDSLLPSRNEVCTARTTSILDHDNTDTVTAHLLYKNGNSKKITDCTAEYIEENVNVSENEISDVIIECSIPGVRNIQKPLLIVDTPGANNFADPEHRKITLDYLNGMKSGLILFVINATQIGTNDSSELLESIHNIVSEKRNVDIAFVLNKTDELDTEKEPLDKIISNTAHYISELGFESPEIYPTSARAALLFRKAIYGKPLTAKERADFAIFYSYFEPTDYCLSSYALTSKLQNVNATVSIGNKEYLLRDLYSAIQNTGIYTIEKFIENKIIDELDSCFLQKI